MTLKINKINGYYTPEGKYKNCSPEAISSLISNLKSVSCEINFDEKFTVKLEWDSQKQEIGYYPSGSPYGINTMFKIASETLIIYTSNSYAPFQTKGELILKKI